MAVPRLPVFYRKDLAKRHLRLERSLCLDKPESIADTVYMDVDANGGKVKADCDGEVRGLASDAGELAKFLDGIRQDTAEFLLENFRKRLQMPCLVVVEANGEDLLFDFLCRNYAK